MDQGQGQTIATETIPFKPLAEGVLMRVVFIDPVSAGWTIMINAKPGSVLPRHQHLTQAEIYILAGAGSHPQTGDYQTGDYVIEPAGAVHDAVVFDEEVMLIMRSQGDVAFLAEDGSTMFLMDQGMLTHFAA